MPDIEDVLADAQREIKAIGDNVRSLKETTDKSLADVRKLVEDAPKSLTGSDQFKKDVEALVAGFRPSGKRYKRVTITPANNTGNAFVAGIWITKPLIVPSPNPPL
jgi:hypothetical protein